MGKIKSVSYTHLDVYKRQELKKADISSLKTVFTGYNSFAGKTAQKAAGISNAANRASATYTNNGTYSKTNSSLTSSKIDKEV